MPPSDKDGERLAQAVMVEARADAEKIRAEAQAKAATIRQGAQAQAEAETREILGRAALEAERIQRQSVASAELKARMLQLEHREKLLRGVFEATRQKFATVQQWKDYDQIALQLLREALVHLKANAATIRADPATRQHLAGPVLETLAKEMDMQLSLAEPLDHGLGVIAETVDGRIHYDNTFETRLARLQNLLRAAVNHILMGEAL